MKKLYLSLLLFSFALSMSAENDTIIIRDTNTMLIENNLDSLVHLWYVTMSRELNPVDFGNNNEPVVEFPDSVYKMRLESIHSIVPLPYNNIVRNHIHVYTGKKRDKFEIMLGMKEYYFPMIEDIFDSYGLPAELKYMAVIESALNPRAVSRVGATGLWQFMYSTGRAYGLTINSVVDERRDPVKSTHAAARYIRDLYRIYKDWGLVIAAYNCGPGNVNKAIRRSGNRKDYWEIYYRLPRETRGYLPGYIAATYSMSYYKEHNIKPVPVSFPVATDTIMIARDIYMAQVSAVLDIPAAELRALNPQYKTGLIPGKSRAMPLTLPMNYLGKYITMQDTVYAYMRDTYFKPGVKTASPTRSTYIPPSIKGKSKLVYTVKEGDNLGYIAGWYNVGLSEVRYWNNIYRNTIRIGQKINVYVDPSKKDYYSAVNRLSFDKKQARIGKTVKIATATPQPSGQGQSYLYYTVKSGDTVWDIAKKYDGISVTDILKINGMQQSSKIRVGQKIRIKSM